jgi:multicomponent Na+:H+ antiporter subunit B
MTWTGQWMELLILTLLACTAVSIVRRRGLFAAAMLTGIYSFLGASWMLLLDAPDVSFTEAAVGAGVSTILMLATLAMTGQRAKRPVRSSIVPLLVVLLTGAALIYGTLDMPHVGDPQAPVQLYPSPSYIERTLVDFSVDHETDIEVPNVITAVLGSYRGYDTLGETTVIFTAAIAVLLLLRGRPRRRLGDRS